MQGAQDVRAPDASLPPPTGSKPTTSSKSFRITRNIATHHHTWGSWASCPLCSHRMCRVMDPSPPATAPNGVDAGAGAAAAAAAEGGATSTRVLGQHMGMGGWGG